jgi:hypothetical protein
MFNSVAQQYGLIGAGVFVPQNYYGSGPGSPANGIQQGTEEYGLPFRQFWVTTKISI